MAEVVVNSTSKMSDADIRAIAVYLKDLPAGAPEPAVTPPPPAEMAAGEDDLRAAPASPAMRPTARGAPRIYPPLPGNANLQSADPSSTLRIILDGARDGDDAARAQHRIDAGLRQQIVGSGDRRRHELHPQFLGQCRACGDARRRSRRRAAE